MRGAKSLKKRKNRIKTRLRMINTTQYEKTSKNHPLGFPMGGIWEALGHLLGALGRLLGAPWKPPLLNLGTVGHQFGVSPVWSETVL